MGLGTSVESVDTGLGITVDNARANKTSVLCHYLLLAR